MNHTFYAKALAVKRVTSNKGRKTPGVDGILWKGARAKWQAIFSLQRRGYRPQPLRRIYIPKKNGKKRPLSIPTMICRAMRFGSWTKALEAAGFKESKRPWGGDLSETRIPESQLIEDMKRVAEALGKNAITISEYEKHGKFGSSAISKRFGGWNKAKDAAGLKIGR